MNWLKTLWEAVKFVFPFLPKKTIAKYILDKAEEYANRTQTEIDNDMVDFIKKGLAEMGFDIEEDKIKLILKEHGKL